MGQSVSFAGYTPPARFDAVSWTSARIREAPASSGPWTLIDTVSIGAADTDPAHPQARSFTTNAGTGPDLWYSAIFVDSFSNVSEATTPFQNGGFTGAYVDRDELKKTLTLDGTTFADDDIDRAIAAAQTGINEACGRRFDRDISVDTIRFYRPQSATVILIDDAISVTSLETDQDGDFDYERDWELDLECVLEPLNAVTDGWPYTRISLNTYRGSAGFPFWLPKSVKVTAKFGWPALPAPIPQAATLLASKLIKLSREAPFGVVTVGIDVGSAIRIARTDPVIGPMLAPFVREKIV